jgi:hypothetical protein
MTFIMYNDLPAIDKMNQKKIYNLTLRKEVPNFISIRTSNYYFQALRFLMILIYISVISQSSVCQHKSKVVPVEKQKALVNSVILSNSIENLKNPASYYKLGLYENTDSIITNYYYEYEIPFIENYITSNIHYHVIIYFTNNEDSGLPDKYFSRICFNDCPYVCSDTLYSHYYEFNNINQLISQKTSRDYIISHYSSPSQDDGTNCGYIESEKSSILYDSIIYYYDTLGLIIRSTGYYGDTKITNYPKIDKYFDYSFDELQNKAIRYDSIINCNYKRNIYNYSCEFSHYVKNEFDFSENNQLLTWERYLKDSTNKEWKHYYIETYTYDSENTWNYEKIVSVWIESEDTWSISHKVITQYQTETNSKLISTYFFNAEDEWILYKTDKHYLTREETGITNHEAIMPSNALFIYPNPTNGNKIFLKLPESIAGGNYQIYTLSGQVIREGKINMAPGIEKVYIGLQGIYPGYYLVQITGKNGWKGYAGFIKSVK